MDANELKELQALPLEYKVMISQQRIREWYEAWGGQVYVSFSGGKDSTVLLHLVRQLYPEVPAVFCDTGLEFPEIREFVKSHNNVEWLKPTMTFKEVIESKGYPVVSKEQAQYINEARHGAPRKRHIRLTGTMPDTGEPTSFHISKKWLYLVGAPFEISEQCCKVMKMAPGRKYERATKRKPFVGTMASDSRAREKRYIRYGGCNSFDQARPSSNPLGFWLESDVWDYLRTYNVPYCKIYDMGYARTGCMFCAFGAHLEKQPNRFQIMARTHPKQWAYCMEPRGLNMGEVLDFCGIPWKPSEWEQGELFTNDSDI